MAAKSTTARGRRGSKSAATRKKEAQRHANRQFYAIVLFGLGVLLAALTFIKGASVWTWFHNLLFGLFGAGAIFVPVLLVYIAILLTMDKPSAAQAWMGGMLIVCFCGALQIFQMGLPENEPFLEVLVDCIKAGIGVQSGGFFGVILGLPLLYLCGELGAGILIVLLTFVFLMLMTGGTLIGLARAANKPVKKIGEVYTDQQMRNQERSAQRAAQPPAAPAAKTGARRSLIDIPLPGDEPPPEPAPEAASSSAAPAEQPDTQGKPPEAAALSRKFEIDIPLDDDFSPAKSGGFSLGLTAEAMEYVPSAPPSIDELVSKAATETGKFDFAGQEAEKRLPEDIFGEFATQLADLPEHEDSMLQLSLPPDIDDVEGLEAAERPMQNLPPPEPLPPPQPPFYRMPPLTLLREIRKKNDSNLSEEMKINAQRLVDTLASFGVQTRIVDISRGPAVTRYELQPSAGVKISKITGLADDIALNLAAAGVRIEAPIPNKAAVGIEVPNKDVSAVTLREIIDSPEFSSAQSKISVALGRDITGNATLADLGKMPHLLIAGSTGSGKSVCINSIIMSLLFRAKPDEVRFLMIDPKVVELGVYNGIPHLLVPVVTDPKKAAGALSWAVAEMLKRYKLFADHSVRDLKSFNALADRTEGMEKMPQVVIIIDELADLMMAAPNEIEDYICRLAQMARAAGMHLIIATQRPSVDVITGVIKANIPSRIAFAVSSQIDSRTILDMGGAEKLLGRGDMLFSPVGASKPLRVQGCYVTDEEIEAVISFIKNDATADYDQQIVEEIDSHVVAGKGAAKSGGGSESANSEENDDEMLMPAIECVVEAGMASTSLLQRRLKLGYARAARIVDEMESRGIVGPFEGSKPRQVLITPERLAEMKLSQQD